MLETLEELFNQQFFEENSLMHHKKTRGAKLLSVV